MTNCLNNIINHISLSPQWHEALGRIIFMRGLPRTGKSTLANLFSSVWNCWLEYAGLATAKELDTAIIKLHPANFQHLPWMAFNLDDYRLATYGQEFCRAGEAYASGAMYTSIKVFLKHGYNIIIDDTHTSTFSLRQIFMLDVNAQYCDVIPDNIDTISKRQTDTGDTIPVQVFRRLWYQYHHINPETVREQYKDVNYHK